MQTLKPNARILSPRLAAACAAVLALAACDRFAQQPAAPDTAELELAWARAALERNPNIEVIASDAPGRVFTIRDKRTGEVQVAPLDQIAAAPVAALTAMNAPTPPMAAAPTSEAAAAASASAAQTAAAAPAEPTQAATSASTAASVPAQSTSSDAGYTIERNAGQLRVTGPGVSIVSAGQSTSGAQASQGARASEPIICEGRRMLHFDNREIFVEGDAITVRDGCEMFITNSRIVASGIGVTVQNGVVHVSNSHIEGAQGSFEADAQAKMYVRGSTFQGLPRRDALAMVQDQGGNRWR